MEKRFLGLSRTTFASLIGIFALCSFALAATAMQAAAQSQLTIQLNPSSGPVGTPVGVTGLGFSGGQTSISFNGVYMTQAYPGMFGRISSTFMVPPVSPGSYTVTATTSTGVTASATFTVTQGSTSTPTPGGNRPTASITLNRNQGAAGQTITLSGSGFGSSNTVSINFGATPVTSVTADIGGAINTAFTVPLVTAGSYIVSASSSGGAYASVQFTVGQAGLPATNIPTASPGQVTKGAGFWSTPVIIAIVAIVAAAVVVPIFLLRRRGKREPLLEEAPAPVTPSHPAYQAPAYNSSPPSPYNRQSYSKQPSIASRYDQFASYGRPSSYVRQPGTPYGSHQTGRPSSYNRPATYTPQTSQRPTYNLYSQSSRYTGQPARTAVCHNCKRPVRDDYSVCPYCKKRLK